MYVFEEVKNELLEKYVPQFKKPLPDFICTNPLRLWEV